MTSNPVLRRAMPVLQAFFYIAFVILWFKDNFPALKAVRLSSLWAFIPLVTITVARLVIRARSGKLSLSAGWKRDAAAIAVIIVLATLTRVPFLAHSFGLMDSDEAIPALMSKHIAEGRQPPLYFYGAFFQGSLPQHFTAAFVRAFGYSVPLAKWTAFMAFALFLAVQFLLLKKLFSFGFACATGLFYVLPWRELVLASTDLASGFPVVLLLASLAFYLAAGAVFEDRADWLAPLGFVLGLAFWSHQISVIFCAVIAPFLIYKYRLRIERYLGLAAWFAVGCLPLVLNELARGFPIVRVFFLGQSTDAVFAGRLERARRFLLGLISAGPEAADAVYLGIMAAGFLTIVLLVVLRKTRPAALILPAYFTTFLAVYLLSRSGGTPVSRYLYILYIAVPGLLAAPFLWLKTRFRFAAAAALFALIFTLSQAGVSRTFLADVSARHESLKGTVAAMKATGETCWISEFWTSYLLTSLSGEEVVVASKDVRRYYPYELRYWSEGRTNWVIPKHRDTMELYGLVIPDVLDRVGADYKRQDTGEYTLLYRISQEVFPRIFLADPPESLPEVRLSGQAANDGALSLEFERLDSLPTPGLGFEVEVPGYCSRFWPMWESGRFVARVPFPLRGETRIRFGFTYAGFRLRRGMQEADWTPGPGDLEQPRPEVEFLEGIGPQREAYGRPMFVCRKKAALEVNRPAGRGSKLALDLYCPFDFKEPFWYGDYAQSVAVTVNGRRLGEHILGDGKTTVAIDLDPELFTGRGDIVGLEFKYAMPVSITENFKTAAYLERVAFEELTDRGRF